MRTRHLTTLMTVVSLLALGQALAQPPTIPNFQRRQVLTADELNRMVGQINKNTNALSEGDGETHSVDCATGTIAAAMQQAQPGDTIMIAAGTCNEAVVVNKDGITLAGAGQDSTVIDGDNIDASVILVKGQQNVTIKDLTVQNGLIGVHVGLGASAWLENVTAKDSRYKAGHNSGFGILIANSSEAILTGNIVASGNGSQGILVWQGGRASVVGNLVFEGSRMPQASLRANDNESHGIELGLSSSLQVHAPDGQYTTVRANGNGGRGIHLGKGSSAQFGGGADIEATGNGLAGLFVGNGSSVAFVGWGSISRGFTGTFNGNGGLGGIAVSSHGSIEVWDDGVASSIAATGNKRWGFGLFVSDGSVFVSASPNAQSASEFDFSENDGIGIGVYRNSTTILRLPSRINDNGRYGIHAWGNSWVEIGTDTEGRTTISGNGENGIGAWNGVGIYLRNTTATGNTGADISTGQGSRLDWSDSQIDTVYCGDDGSVLAYGEASCPEDE